MCAMLRIDEQIMNSDKVICRHIDSLGNASIGEISQDILSQLRHFVEHIMLKIYANGNDIEDSQDNVRNAVKYVKNQKNFKHIARFHRFLQVSVSHRTLAEENANRLMLKYYELLVFKMDHPEMNFARETVRDIIRCFAYDLLSNITKHFSQSDGDDMLRQSDRIFRKFMLLLAENSNVNRSVKSYADELCVSPKYLTSVCRKHSDSTASELIATSVMSRVKQLLLYSDLSIKEVAGEMGFDNLSFFGKYVKKHLGLSPNHYRKANGYGK